MATNVRGTHQVVFALREHGQDMERETHDELHQMAAIAGRTMQRLVPKNRSTLWKSIDVRRVNATTYDIRPTVNYGASVEFGVKAGGKGLPRFFDPAAASIVDWLKSKAFTGQARVRKGTGRFSAQQLELRDRYEGLAWHIRHHGTKAQPFVEPTAREMEAVMPRRMELAVLRVLARRPDGAGGAVA